MYIHIRYVYIYIHIYIYIYTYTYIMCIYIYIYTHIWNEENLALKTSECMKMMYRSPFDSSPRPFLRTANLRTTILDFRGLVSSRILISRGEIPRPIGDSPESVSQRILVGMILVGSLGVRPRVVRGGYGILRAWI